MKSFATFILLAACVLIASASPTGKASKLEDEREVQMLKKFGISEAQLKKWMDNVLSDENNKDYPIAWAVLLMGLLEYDLSEKYDEQPEEQPILYFNHQNDMFEYVSPKYMSEERKLINMAGLKLLFKIYRSDIIHNIKDETSQKIVFLALKEYYSPRMLNSADFWEILSRLHAHVASSNPKSFKTVFHKLPSLEKN
ncbi:uncharacterized protein LOC106651972 [Trichogramma pretiosum]|uniref:uncharacterized protein LOC106651972 n=1 Tax=Trichogramma pretiosum TaxID=7493 RepID=UPI0006C93C64|nr:uncharacterized protein LOC106651972 [Trichogramma pretiosum]